MIHLIIELSKYLNILLIILYTFYSFRVLSEKKKLRQRRQYTAMAVLMYMIHANCYMVMFITTMEASLIIFYFIQLAAFLAAQVLYKACYGKMSGLVFRNMLFFLMIGFVMLTRLSVAAAIGQFIIAFVALGGCLLIPAMIQRFRLWENLGYFYLLIGLAALGILLFIGMETYGAKNWLVIGNLNFQPSEFVKILFVFGISAMLRKYRSFRAIVAITLIAAAHVIILVLEKDLGAALLFFVTYVVLLYGATSNIWYLSSGLISGVVAAFCAFFAFSHVRVRVLAFLDPFGNIQLGGYQVAQSLFAIGTGGWFGTGLQQGLPNSIPVAQSDFIFSAITEEFGGIFAICLIFICISCFIMFINISVRLDNPFYKLVALGFGTMYIFQVFLNIGGVIKFIPSTGITLPLVSSGGSSLLGTIIMFSIIQGMYVLRQKELHQEDTAIEHEEQQRLKQNKTILRLTYVFSGLLFLTVVYLGYFIQIKSDETLNSAHNQRQDLLSDRIVRGEILSSDKKVLAQTLTAADGTETRDYPYGRIFSHLVGRRVMGYSGIELSENYTLLTSNVNGFVQLKNELNDIKNQGDRVITTFNAKLQKIAYEALGDYRGSIVVLEPSTGKILAMVSKPAYSPRTVEEDWKDLINDESSPLLNRAANGLYAPGSTFKILVLLHYIRENKEYKKFEFICEGTTRVNHVTIHCPGNRAHGRQDLMEAFANSCNCAFATLGSDLNMNKFRKFTEEFLFNRVLPSSLSTSMSSFVLNGNSDPNDFPQTMIGLGKTQMTPLHSAMITAAIANGGLLMQPYHIDSIKSYDGKLVRENSPKAYASLLTKEEAELITKYMEAVVDHGTASGLSGLSVSAAGKTGSATYDIEKEPHAWFTGFAPVNNPKIAVSVIVESAGGGSSYAVPIAKKIFQAYFE